MTCAEMLRAVVNKLQGYGGLSVGYTPDEIVSALNAAQQYVLGDLISLLMRKTDWSDLDDDDATSTDTTLPTWVIRFMELGYTVEMYWSEALPRDSVVDPDWRSMVENAPAMLVDASVEPVAPYYAHDAIVTRAAITLAPKYGDLKENIRVQQFMAGQYEQEMVHARQVQAIMAEKRRVQVKDYNDPMRFLMQEW